MAKKKPEPGYTVKLYGKVCTPRGQVHGWKGSTGGLTFGNVVSHLRYAKLRGEHVQVFDGKGDDVPNTVFKQGVARA